MGSLALRPGNSLAILEDGFVNRLQDSQFPSFLLFKLRGLGSYPDGTLTHCSCQPSLDAHISVLIRLAAAPKGQHSHVVEAWDAVGKRPHIVKAGVDQLGRLPRSLPVHQCHDAVHAVLTTLVAGF